MSTSDLVAAWCVIYVIRAIIAIMTNTLLCSNLSAREVILCEV